MSRSLSVRLGSLLAIGALSACSDSKSAGPTGPTPQAPAPFSVNVSVYPVGGTRPVPGTSLAITLERVVEDKRCPSGGPCPQPGMAVVELTVLDNGVPVRERFTMSAVDDFGPPAWHDEREIAGYRFRLTTVTPVPWRGQAPDPTNPLYSANLRVQR